MTTLKPIEPIDDIDLDPEGLSPLVVEELEGVLEGAGLDAYLGHPETKHWYSWVPMAGVRYYTYEDHPSPLEGAARPSIVKGASPR